jgi:cation diffusion facilitator CzcD-associated flavoprotein CzcO
MLGAPQVFPMSDATERRIVIIGSGFSGLCLGIDLLRAGIHSFTILEKADRLGGTWRENTYPGAACDVPSISYCFSFEQKTDWSRLWSPQAEILAYMEHCAEKYGLTPHIRYGVAVERARFDAGSGEWRIRTTAGEEIRADVLVSGVGQLNRPHFPDLPGLDSFAGECFHSARWNHACELRGRTVGVIGNAASAIQFVPVIAEQVGKLAIFQRSANWMVPKDDREYTEQEKRRFARFPWLAKLQRWWTWARYEMLFPIFRQSRRAAAAMTRTALEDLEKHIADPALRKALTPDYPIGGKRILFSDDYYPTLTRPNVQLVTHAIDRVEKDAVVTRDGVRHPVDVLILATGFESTAFLAPMEIEGPGGRSLRGEWGDAPVAYMGMTVSGFPNFFMMYGPNTNLGHNSIIFMIECQSRYIASAIRRMIDERIGWIDVRADVMKEYNERIQRELASSVWATTDRSWYKNRAGRITNNWSGSTIRFWWMTRRPDLSAFEQVPLRQLTREVAAREVSLARA